MKPRAGLGVFAALALVLVLAGCGIHNTGADSAPTPSQPSIATVTPAPTTTAVAGSPAPSNTGEDPLAGIDSDLATAGSATDQASQDKTDGDSAGAQPDNAPIP